MVSWVYTYVQTHQIATLNMCRVFLMHQLCLSCCCCSVAKYPTLGNPWTAAHQASQSFTISQSLLNSCPLSQWYHLTISSSITPFSSSPQFFPASRSFRVSQLFSSGGQRIGDSSCFKENSFVSVR